VVPTHTVHEGEGMKRLATDTIATAFEIVFY
jgi:hypothetical protein